MPDAAVTLARFEPLVGSAFTLQLGEAGSLTAQLIEAKPGHWAPAEGRAPFSLMFEAPGPALPQRIYRLEHEQAGSMDIFLVPVARTTTGLQYEAVFG